MRENWFVLLVCIITVIVAAMVAFKLGQLEVRGQIGHLRYIAYMVSCILITAGATLVFILLVTKQ